MRCYPTQPPISRAINQPVSTYDDVSGTHKTSNDMRFADAMSAAIPYCDVVMTDDYVATQLAKSRAIARHRTLVLSRLSDINDALPNLIASHHRDGNGHWNRRLATQCPMSVTSRSLALRHGQSSGCAQIAQSVGSNVGSQKPQVKPAWVYRCFGRVGRAHHDTKCSVPSGQCVDFPLVRA